VLLALALIFISGTLSAQNVRVTGKVIDTKGLPIPGATVLIEGTRTGVATDADGTFNIESPANATLHFSFIGMEDQIIPVDNRSTINVTMAESSVALEEVVVQL